jgi:heterotetrameric sarcosine oxidase delta subunit
MRIECPFCGDRDLAEFSYLGDAGFRRPSADTDDCAQRYYEAVYLRDNPAGPHEELWYHAGGCHCWIHVTRDTRTHEVLAVRLAREPRS